MAKTRIHRARRLCLVGIALFLISSLAASADESKLIGTRAPDWEVSNWINSDPLTLENLRGKVVLVRFWTAPQCPYCKASAPALNEFHGHYEKKGLRIIGLYHHKSSRPLDVGEVKRHARAYEFKFPVAIDRDWKTLKLWWLNHDEQNWTSVTFLIDRNGVIRHIHPGGQYVKGDADYAALKAKIEELLAEKE